MFYCKFNTAYNQCEYLNRDNDGCLAEKSECSFRWEDVKDPPKQPYVRKPRWYEKYYK